jgi:uncharacterized protein YidB (DUF937 family)
VGRLRSILTSRKFNRALPWIAGLVLAIGVAAFIQSRTDTGSPKETFSNEPAQDVTKQQKPVPVPKAARTAAVTFLQTAVARQNLAKAWTVAGPGIKGGQSYQSWLKGNIAVVPYPGESMDKAPIKVDWSYPKSVGLSVALLPKKGTGEKPQVFNMELKKAGKRWVVDSWVPYAPPAVPADLSQ